MMMAMPAGRNRRKFRAVDIERWRAIGEKIAEDTMLRRLALFRSIERARRIVLIARIGSGSIIRIGFFLHSLLIGRYSSISLLLYEILRPLKGTREAGIVWRICLPTSRP